MVSKPGFIDKCELWHERKTLQGVYTDIYDGEVWNDFMSIDGATISCSSFYCFFITILHVCTVQ